MDIESKVVRSRVERCKHGLTRAQCSHCTRPQKPVRRLVKDHVEITGAQTQEFFDAVTKVLQPLSFNELLRVNLLGDGQWGVVVSFGGDWTPFLGHTKGYNNDNKPPRLPIVASSEVLEVAAAWLVKYGRDVAGGRVFVNVEGVICDGTWIGRWSWMGADPVETVRDIRVALLQREITKLSGLTAS